MLELKPCPFCGGEADFDTFESDDDVFDFMVKCTRCFASTYYEETKEKAAAEWNERYYE